MTSFSVLKVICFSHFLKLLGLLANMFSSLFCISVVVVLVFFVIVRIESKMFTNV